MNKYLLIVLLIVSIGLVSAVESDPSATVGYFKKSLASGSWGTMSLPFNYTSLSPDDVYGLQFSEGDMLQDVLYGYNWTFYDGYGWYIDADPPLPLELGKAYWVYRSASNPALDYFIMGKVDPQPVTVTAPANGWTYFSLNDCRNVDPNTLVINDVLEGDMIQDILYGYNWTWYDGYGWYIDADPPLPLEPTSGYWYYTFSPTGYSWTYNPSAPARTGSSTSMTIPSVNKTPDIRTKK